MAARPKTTRYDDETLDKPQSTSPGDAPADTYDPKERVSSDPPDKATAEAAGHKSVNAVKEVAPIPDPPAPVGGGRVETYTAHKPDGTTVVIEHNVDTGATAVDA